MIKKVKVSLIERSLYTNEMLIRIEVIDNDHYSYDEIITLEDIDRFMTGHIKGWLTREYKVDIDQKLYNLLKETKKIYTKEMLRRGSIINT